MRSELSKAFSLVFLYYLGTAILFCNIMGESNICTDTGQAYSGWVSALYFASTTVSTVGYGDLTVSQDPAWRSFIGSAFMIVSMAVAIVASAAAQSTLSPLERFLDKVFDGFANKANDPSEFLYQRIRRVKFVCITEIVFQVGLFILLGVVASQIAVAYESDPEAKWSWMTSFYWAVQTTTTIGYGDLNQPFGLRWFKIFYLIFSTYLVGNSFGKLGSLRAELSEVRKQHAWDRRKVTRRFVDELQAYEHDDKVDQFEFLVASLLSLGKLSSEDIRPIMDKFRSLAGDKGFISVTTDIKEEAVDEEDSDYENDEIDVEE